LQEQHQRAELTEERRFGGSRGRAPHSSSVAPDRQRSSHRDQ
jgi:hypothetical protein